MCVRFVHLCGSVKQGAVFCICLVSGGHSCSAVRVNSRYVQIVPICPGGTNLPSQTTTAKETSTPPQWSVCWLTSVFGRAHVLKMIKSNVILKISDGGHKNSLPYLPIDSLYF